MEYLLYSHMTFGNCHCSVHKSFVGTLCLVTMQIFSASNVCMNDLITSDAGTCFG
jgi:hypothetical protein